MNAEQVSQHDEKSLEGRLTRTQLAKLERTKKQQEHASLGRLAKLFDRYEFRDGVLFSAKLRRRPKGLEEYLNDPQWATLQRLDLGMGHSAELVGRAGALFNSMPLLHTIENLDPRLIPEVPCRRITAVSMWSAPMVQLAEVFPCLRELEFTGYLLDPHEFWGHPFTETLESVTLSPLTWSKGKLTARGGHLHHDCVSWIELGPAISRMELSEDEFARTTELYELRDLFAAARQKGAEVVLVPGDERSWAPPPRWEGRW